MFLEYIAAGTENGEANKFVDGPIVWLELLDAWVGTFVESLTEKKAQCGRWSKLGADVYCRLLVVEVKQVTENSRLFGKLCANIKRSFRENRNVLNV